MTVDEIRDWHQRRGRYRCAVCNTLIEGHRIALERAASATRVTLQCHLSSTTITVSDAYCEDYPKRIVYAFKTNPEHEFNSAKLDRHGRVSSGEHSWQDSTLAPYRPSSKEKR